MNTKLTKQLSRVGMMGIAMLLVIPGIGSATTGTTSGTTTGMAGGGTMMMGTSTMGMGATTTKIIVMKHLCNPSIKNMSDFEALEAGKSPIAALANTVLNCPTTGLMGDSAVAGTVSAPRTPFEFTVSGVGIPNQTLSDADFMQHKVCESNVGIDVNMDGTVSTSTCLDISHYGFDLASTTNDQYVVTETTPPANRHFGALRFTPNDLMANNDSASLQYIDPNNGKIYLDTTADTDKMVMLHVYNFLHGTSTATTTTPGMGGGNQNPKCHGHDKYGNKVWVTAGDNHGHDMNGDDVQMDHCGNGKHGEGMDNAKFEKIQKLQQQILKLQEQILKLLQQLSASM